MEFRRVPYNGAVTSIHGRAEMSEPTLNYGDQKLFALRIPHGIVYAPAYLTLAVYLLPPLLTFLYYFYLPWEILKRYNYADVFGFLAIVTTISSLVVLILSLRARTRRVRALLLLVCNGLPALALFFFMSHYAEWLSKPLLDRRALAAQRMTRVESACISYAERHWDDQGAHFPPHLAALIAGGYLNADDLIDPASSTMPAKVPPGLVEADWPRIAADIDAHSDFVYLGADWVRDGALNQNQGSLILLYSKARHFRAGPLVSHHGFVSETAFGGLWKGANDARVNLLLPPITFGGPVPAPPPPVSYLLAAKPSLDAQNEAARISASRMAKVQNAIINYAIEHEGHFPPHFAALVAGHNIAPEDLLYPGSGKTALAMDLKKLTERDWPAIARELESHCDLIYLAAGLEDFAALDMWCNTPKAISKRMLLFYVKPTFPTWHSRACFFPHLDDDRSRRYEFWGSLREAFMLSREAREHFRLPPVQLNVPPELIIHANSANLIAGAPIASDEASLRREISRRNAMVIAAAIKRCRVELRHLDLISLDFQALLAGHYILPRHLHDPDRQTPLPDPDDADFPRYANDLFATRAETNWSRPAVREYVDLHNDYYIAYNKFVEGIHSEVLVYSKNDYGKTGRIYGFADGTAKFLPDIRHH